MIMSEKEILQHWFFLETEMVEAIMKGNKSLIPAARARVIFLSKVVKPDLVQEGVNGEEDALWKIHKVLHNKGWWEKARNLVISPPAQGEKTSDIDPHLLGFLRTNERYVHPNTRILVRQGNQEGIRMALNQIHYNSLRLLEKNKDTQYRAFSPKLKKDSMNNQLNVLRSFLLAYKSLVEPSVFVDAMKGSDKALSLALGQIHHKTLEGSSNVQVSSQSQNKASYKNTLLHGGGKAHPIPRVASPLASSRSDLPQKKNVVFFTGIDVGIHLGDLWQIFKKEGHIKDVILPRRRDRYGNRIGFVVTTNFTEGEKIIKALNGKLVKNTHLYLSWAKERKSTTNVGESPSMFRKTNSSNLNRDGSTEIAPLKKLDEPYFVSSENLASPPLSELEEGIKGSNLEEIPLSSNEEMVQVTQTSLFVKTVKPETVGNVEMIIEGLGVHGGKVRGLTGNSFLVYFESKDYFQQIDREFLEIGFAEIRNVRIEDLIPTRRAWVEVRGLPLLGWTEENFKKLFDEWGQIQHYCKTVDEEKFYQTPKVLIETHCLENFDVTKSIRLMKKVWKIRLVESHGFGAQLNDVEILSNVSEFECVDHTGTPLETKFSSENFHENQSQARSESHSSILDNNRNDETAIDSQDNGLHSVELLDGEDNAASENEVSTSLLNPPTPRYNVIPFPPYPKLDEAVTENTIHTNLSNWKPRDHDSSVSLVCSPSEEEKSIVDDASVEDKDSLADSHPNIIKDLYNLKVKSRRGRPRNFAAKHINKHFRLPKRKKKKGEGLKQITHFCLNNNLDEGEAIYETGVLMGLLPVHSKEKSMELIRLNLKK